MHWWLLKMLSGVLREQRWRGYDEDRQSELRLSIFSVVSGCNPRDVGLRSLSFSALYI